MSAVTALPQRHVADVTHDAKMVALIRRTVAKDCNEDEFNLFISMARSLRLDPLRKQIYAFVFNRDDAKKRNMSIVTAIDGFRTIADRTGNYRPDEDEPTYEVDADLKSPLNPLGLVKATVRVWKFAHGNWYRVTAPAHWDEYAPIKDEWAENATGKWAKTGKQTLDTSGQWGKMPRHMLAKVAEALALRKGWPDELSNVYVGEEIDRARAAEFTPAELAEQALANDRRARIGGPALIVDWLAGQQLDNVPVGQFADRAMAFIRDNAEEPSTILVWRDRNKHSLREHWAAHPTDALEIKKAIESAVESARTSA